MTTFSDLPSPVSILAFPRTVEGDAIGDLYVISSVRSNNSAGVPFGLPSLRNVSQATRDSHVNP